MDVCVYGTYKFEVWLLFLSASTLSFRGSNYVYGSCFVHFLSVSLFFFFLKGVINFLCVSIWVVSSTMPSSSLFFFLYYVLSSANYSQCIFSFRYCIFHFWLVNMAVFTNLLFFSSHAMFTSIFFFLPYAICISCFKVLVN